jgi:hypothetical protein
VGQFELIELGCSEHVRDHCQAEHDKCRPGCQPPNLPREADRSSRVTSVLTYRYRQLAGNDPAILRMGLGQGRPKEIDYRIRFSPAQHDWQALFCHSESVMMELP